MAKHTNKLIIDRVLLRSWEYLDKNFTKFKPADKLRVALDLCKKNIPQDLNVSGEVKIKLAERLHEARNRWHGTPASGN